MEPPPGAGGPDQRALSEAAIAWYAEHKRDLPWRHTDDPYPILVSEIMLQQTTVAAVIGYYRRFLEAFPTVEALAAADEQEVLARWAGLGYYRRARLLHAAARTIVTEHGGRFPGTPESLQCLPGVGRYTAGAVASFAFDQPAPIVEANTARLYARLFAIPGALSEPKVQRELWAGAIALLPDAGGREHNSALMEIGALVCTPSVPDCERCPVSRWCAARRLGLVDSIPAPVARPEKIPRTFAGAVVSNGNLFLMRRIPPGEWHAGMYEFPKISTEPGHDEETVLRNLSAMLSVHGRIGVLERFAELRYTVTRHAVTLTVWRGLLQPVADPSQRYENHLPDGEFRWMTMGEIVRLPMGSAQRRLLKLVADPDDLFGSAPSK